ncbi:MAG: DegT/DnrJ/EryC1/StrS aminotransferase family protein [Burkholderiales bacterium]
MAIRSNFLVFGRPNFGDAEIAAVTRAMRSGWVGMGPECIAFEGELASYLGVRNVVTVSSCTAALHLSMVALDIGPGDEVIVPSLTWYATANAALYVGAKPVLCDVDRDSLCVTPESVLARVSDRTRAVIPVHFGGHAIDIARLRELLPSRIVIVEDAAHALGSRFADSAMVGASGNLSCFSFYANKNLSTAEGGAITLADDNRADRLRSLRQSGLSADAWKRYIDPNKAIVPSVAEVGFKANFTDLQASIGRVQLARQSEFAAVRERVAGRYRQRLEGSFPGLQFQAGAFSSVHAKHLLVVILPLERLSLTRDQLLLGLRARNIGASIHYRPIHRTPLYGTPASSVPNTEWLADRIMTLPISASMTEADVDYVCDHMLELLGAKLAS